MPLITQAIKLLLYLKRFDVKQLRLSNIPFDYELVTFSRALQKVFSTEHTLTSVSVHFAPIPQFFTGPSMYETDPFESKEDKSAGGFYTNSPIVLRQLLHTLT